MKDLFGVEIPDAPLPKGERPKHKTLPAGYAAPPGTGPYGETCKTCCHATANQMAKNYWKCAKIHGQETKGLTCRKSMVMHLDGRDTFSTHYEATVETVKGTIHLAQTVVGSRRGR